MSAAKRARLLGGKRKLHTRSPRITGLLRELIGPGQMGTSAPTSVTSPRKTLEAYSSQPNLIVEHANHEEDTARGGYANRQLFETGAEQCGRFSWVGSRSHSYPVNTDTFVLRRRGTAYRYGWRNSAYVLSPIPQARNCGNRPIWSGLQVSAGCHRHARVLQPLWIVPLQPNARSRTHKGQCARC